MAVLDASLLDGDLEDRRRMSGDQLDQQGPSWIAALAAAARSATGRRPRSARAGTAHRPLQASACSTFGEVLFANQHYAHGTARRQSLMTFSSPSPSARRARSVESGRDLSRLASFPSPPSGCATFAEVQYAHAYGRHSPRGGPGALCGSPKRCGPRTPSVEDGVYRDKGCAKTCSSAEKHSARKLQRFLRGRRMVVPPAAVAQGGAGGQHVEEGGSSGSGASCAGSPSQPEAVMAGPKTPENTAPSPLQPPLACNLDDIFRQTEPVPGSSCAVSETSLHPGASAELYLMASPSGSYASMKQSLLSRSTSATSCGGRRHTPKKSYQEFAGKETFGEALHANNHYAAGTALRRSQMVFASGSSVSSDVLATQSTPRAVASPHKSGRRFTATSMDSRTATPLSTPTMTPATSVSTFAATPPSERCVSREAGTRGLAPGKLPLDLWRMAARDRQSAAPVKREPYATRRSGMIV
eukprot:TRINITY_DN14074_c0_g1_i2.p1 TRINITY_DN14074_c0_g1~~TRINITY_DN14074_c0_g1_i2.p1  ORF type:complete len:470 (+),score=53.99 TRINITY_DN14074_c0_g1_i2:76-1485(+)